MANSSSSRAKPRLRVPRLLVNSAFFAALSDPTRVRVLQFLCTPGAGEMQAFSAGDIARGLELPASTLSHHLKLLTSAGILVMAKAGKEHRYRLQLEALGSEFQKAHDQIRLLQRTAEGVAQRQREALVPARPPEDEL